MLKRVLLTLLLLCALPAAGTSTELDCTQDDNADLKIRACTTIIDRDQRAAWAYIQRSFAYLEMRSYESAIADTTKAIEIEGDNALAYVIRGTALGEQSKNDRAVADFTTAIQVSRDGTSLRAMAHTSRAGAYIKQGEYERAISDCTKAIQINANDASAHNGRAWAYLKSGRPADALPDAERALQIRPGDPSALNARGHIYEALGRRDQAIADLRRAFLKGAKGVTEEALKRLGVEAKDGAKIEIVPDIPHSNFVLSVAFSPDGRHVLSGGADNALKLWEVGAGALVRTFEGHQNHVVSVAFSPDGSRVLSGSRDKTIKLWDAATGVLVHTFDGHADSVSSVTFSPDGSRVLSGSSDKTLKLWDAATGALVRTFTGHAAPVRSVAFSPDGARVLSGSGDANDRSRGVTPDFTMRLWDAATGSLLRTFEGHEDEVSAVAFSRDGMQAISGSRDMKLRRWDVATGALLKTIETPTYLISVTRFSPEGHRILSAGSEDPAVLRLWDSATGALVRTFKGHSSHITSAAFSPDGGRLVASSFDETLKLWDVATGALVRTFEGHTSPVTAVAFSPDSARIVTGSDDRALRLWTTANGALVRSFGDHENRISSVAFSPDGRHIASGSWQSSKSIEKLIRGSPDDGPVPVKLWDTATGALARTFEGHSRGVSSVAFSADGARVLSGGSEGIVKLWDTGTGALVRTFEGRSGPVSSIAISPDGLGILSGSWQTLQLWDVATGTGIRVFEGHKGHVVAVAFSPDGGRVASASDSAVRLWNAATGLLLRAFEGHSADVLSIAFSADGRHLASGSQDRTVKLWDVATGVLVRTFEGHLDGVSSVAFSRDGRLLVSGGRDAATRLWDVTTGTQLAGAIGGRDGQWVTITPAGFFAGSSSGNAMLSIVRGLQSASIDQVHQSLFSPDLVREALAGDTRGEVAEAAAIANLQSVLESGPAPQVEITSHPEGSQSSADLVKLGARVVDKGKGVGRIEWRINGVTAAVAAKPTGRGPVYTLAQQLALDPGDNVIEVVAYNASNVLASLPARTSIRFAGSVDRAKPKLHILAIGINAYEDRGWTPAGRSSPSYFPPLGLAAKDATTFGADMKQAGGALYGVVQVTYALDRNATKANLDKVVSSLARQVHPRDTFVLFVAGHGFSVRGRFYLIPQDYQGGENPDALARNAIGQETLQDWLANRIRAKKALVLLDTCESGALVAGHLRSRADGPISDAAVGRLHEATGRPVLTAAALGQFAYEGVIARSGDRHGIFTWAVLDALRNGDTSANGEIELAELVAHVQTMVPRLAAELGGSGRTATGIGGSTIAVSAAPPPDRQTARFGSRGENFALVKRLTPAATSTVASPQPPNGSPLRRPAQSKVVAPDWRREVWSR